MGKAVARALADDGAAVALVDVDGARLERIAAELGPSTAPFTCDIADHAAVERCSSEIASRLGEATILVNNAGVLSNNKAEATAPDEWRRVLSVNLDGAFLSLRAALRSMRDGGSMVAVASAAGLKAEPGVAAYGASKAALIQLSKVAAKEMASRRIRVNAIAPGGVETAVWDAVPMFADRAREVGREEAFSELAAMATPLGRFATAEEVAEQIAFLLSDQAATITGSVLLSDGGYAL